MKTVHATMHSCMCIRLYGSLRKADRDDAASFVQLDMKILQALLWNLKSCTDCFLSASSLLPLVKRSTQKPTEAHSALQTGSSNDEHSGLGSANTKDGTEDPSDEQHKTNRPATARIFRWVMDGNLMLLLKDCSILCSSRGS